MEYQVVIGRDRLAQVWYVRTTNIPGLALEDPSLDNLLHKLPNAIGWLFRGKTDKDEGEVPFEVLLVEHELARISGSPKEERTENGANQSSIRNR